MHVHLQARETPYRARNLEGQCAGRLWLSALARKQGVRRLRQQQRTISPHIPGEDIHDVGRQLKVNRLLVLRLVLADDEVEFFAARNQMLVDVETCEVLQSDGRHLK